MQSKLFKKIAELSGLTLYNWKDKIEYSDNVQRIEPVDGDDYKTILKLSQKYFKRLIVQDKFIKSLTKIMDEYDFEVQKWDLIQANHEQEIKTIKKECEEKIKEVEKSFAHSRVNILKDRVAHLEAQAKRDRNRIADLEKIANKKRFDTRSTKLLNLLEYSMGKLVYNPSKDAGLVRNMMLALKTYLEKKEVKIEDEILN